jgi:glycerol-3-phosphate dehydrogenase
LIGAGIGLYTLLGFDRNRHMPASMRIPLPRWISRRSLQADLPWLDPEGLRGAFVYYDTLNEHPERLLLAMLQSAIDLGAVVRTYTEVDGFEWADRPDGGIAVRGVLARDVLTGQRVMANARCVINASGPWIDVVMAAVGRPLGVAVRRSKGSHVLTTPIAGVPNARDTVFARARSGNHVIVSPWQGMSLIGPTDIATDAHPDEVATEAADVSLILDTVNDTIGSRYPKLTDADIETVLIGIRPLVVDEGVSSYRTSRRHELYDHSSKGVHGVFTIAGGKWTTSRATGVEVAETVARSPQLAGRSMRTFDSRAIGVHGAFGWAEEPAPFLAAAVARHRTLPAATVEHLARLYGTDFERVVALADSDPALALPLSERTERRDIAAQALYAVQAEGARTLADVLDRRLVLGTLGKVSEAEITSVASVVASQFGWDDEARDAAIRAEVVRRAAIDARWRAAAVRE